MASNITDLENELLALTKRRVEIDTQWIEVSEKLLAARNGASGAGTQVEVPPVSEPSEANPIVSTTETTSAHAQSPATRGEAESNTGDAQNGAKSPQPVQSEVLATVPPSNIDVLPNSSNPVETARPAAPPSNLTIPPPPTTFPENASSISLPQSPHSQPVRNAPNALNPQQPDQNVHSQGLGIALGNRQLLRSPRQSQNFTQQEINAIFQNVSGPFSNAAPQSAQHLFSHMYPRGPQDQMQIDPRMYMAWPPQQQMLSPRQIKAEHLPYFPHHQQGPPQMPQDQNIQSQTRYFHMPQQPPFPSTRESLNVASQPFTQNRDQIQHNISPRTQTSGMNLNTGPLSQEVNTSRRRQRSPSVQFMDSRPRQRPRLAEDSLDRVATPPLNGIKVEEGVQSIIRDIGSDRFSRAQAPPPQVVNQPRRDNNPLAPVSTGLGDNRFVLVNPLPMVRSVEVHNPSSADQQPFHRQLLAPGSHRNPPTRATQENRDIRTDSRNDPRNAINNGEEEEEEEEEGEEEAEEEGEEEEQESESPVDDEIPVPRIRYQRPQASNPRLENLTDYADETSSPLTARLATRRAFNAYRVNESKPLSYAERQELELRYCARVAMIIGSKRCVIAPCQQISKTKNIFTIMRQKFGHLEDEQGVDPINPNTLYRSASDFVTDARGMLKCYVKLGHCDPCPFRATGNERVMCWRMRLESVLDEKMRGLKKCLKECEEIYEVDDMDGRAKHVDMWFSDEELRDEVPIM